MQGNNDNIAKRWLVNTVYHGLKDMNLKQLGILTICIAVTLPVVYTYGVLRFQIDPFDSTTIMMAQLITHFGSYDRSYAYVQNAAQIFIGGWTWQQNVATFLPDFPGSGLLLASLHLMTNAPIVSLSYLPIPYAIVILGSYLINKLVWKMIQKNSKYLPVFIAISCLSVYSEVVAELVGRFYGLEFHAENLSLYVLFLFLLIKGVNEGKVKAYTSIMILLFMGMLIIHYSEPVFITGGLLVYLAVLVASNRLGANNRKQIIEISYLTICLSVLESLQAFYFTTFSNLNQFNVEQRFVSYLSGGISQISFLNSQFVPHSKVLVYESLLSKSYADMMFALVTLVSILYLVHKGTRRAINRSKKVFFLFTIIIGSSLAYSLSYFAFYGGINLGFQYTWILQLLLVLSLFSIGVDLGRKRLSTVGSLCIVILMFLVVLNSTFSTMLLIVNSSEGSFSTQQSIGSSEFLDFVTNNGSNNRYLIGSSVGMTSLIFRDLSQYPISNLPLVIPTTLGGYTRYYADGGILNLTSTLKSQLNYMVVPTSNIQNGLWGDVNSYYNSSIVSGIVLTLNGDTDIVYSSNVLYAYYFQK